MVSEINVYVLDVLGFQYSAAVWIGSFLVSHVHAEGRLQKTTPQNGSLLHEAMQASSESWPHFEVASPQFPTGWPSSHAYLEAKLHTGEDSKL